MGMSKRGNDSLVQGSTRGSDVQINQNPVQQQQQAGDWYNWISGIMNSPAMGGRQSQIVAPSLGRVQPQVMPAQNRSGLMNVAGGAMTGGRMGGPGGAVAGGILGLLGLI